MKKYFFILLIVTNFSFAKAEVTLKFVREDSIFSGISDAIVYLNEEKIGVLSNAGSFEVKVNPGVSVLKIDTKLSPGEFKKKIEFEDEAVYKLTVGPRKAMSGFALFGAIGLLVDNKKNKDEESSDNGNFRLVNIEKE